MEQLQLNYDLAAQLRDTGMDAAILNAEKETQTDWGELALLFLVQWIAKQPTGKRFMTENVRSEAEKSIPKPTNARAWGGIMVQAAKLGFIEKDGYGKVSNIKAHCTPATIWKTIKR